MPAGFRTWVPHGRHSIRGRPFFGLHVKSRYASANAGARPRTKLDLAAQLGGADSVPHHEFYRFAFRRKPRLRSQLDYIAIMTQLFMDKP